MQIMLDINAKTAHILTSKGRGASRKFLGKVSEVREVQNQKIQERTL